MDLRHRPGSQATGPNGPGSEASAAAPAPATLGPAAPPTPAFAHASEAELSRILDFYGVRWDYEPHVFPILWNTDGDVLESFAPDFYLPDADLYVELTTLRQRLVRKKNRKLRRLRELYPGIRIKLFYARDFRALMLKYGRLALADELSGTPGQATPQRSAEALLTGPFPSGSSPPGPPGLTDRRSVPDTADQAASVRPARPVSGSRSRRRRSVAVAALAPDCGEANR